MALELAASLAVLVIGLAWLDRRTQRIPNWVTLPLLAAFIWLNWPGAPETWLGCLLLFLAWKSRWVGGGDAKLWMALLWAVPAQDGGVALQVMGLSFLATGLLQLLWRRLRGQELLGKRTPAAWRALPYVAWLLTLG